MFFNFQIHLNGCTEFVIKCPNKGCIAKCKRRKVTISSGDYGSGKSDDVDDGSAESVESIMLVNLMVGSLVLMNLILQSMVLMNVITNSKVLMNQMLGSMVIVGDSAEQSTPPPESQDPLHHHQNH